MRAKVFNTDHCGGETESNPSDQCTASQILEPTDESPVKSYSISCRPFAGWSGFGSDSWVLVSLVVVRRCGCTRYASRLTWELSYVTLFS
ncbi:uncharacterized protein EKO05_0002732 [Ascochyta rabiei]|uniref:uncharacterized protein n=1 Tax=Didymella rabiei TaxID=5454 RepID=UPI00220B8DDD|nr:uncharacterized protein EKO05_0002732 [Ascochyta rabiei]UPX12166.1 hypothetical protein EKO05_0002732 [Ascochyta rabiei]